MTWPALSPDLNPIENLWAILVRKVYAGGRQFFNIQDLKAEITRRWKEIPLSTLVSLINSMPKRCIEVAVRNGSKTKY